MNKEMGSQETREDRFRRVASRRTQEILDKLRLLGNCAERANYAYTDEQLRKIFSAIDEKVKDTKARFNHKMRSRETSFRLE